MCIDRYLQWLLAHRENSEEDRTPPDIADPPIVRLFSANPSFGEGLGESQPRAAAVEPASSSDDAAQSALSEQPKQMATLDMLPLEVLSAYGIFVKSFRSSTISPATCRQMQSGRFVWFVEEYMRSSSQRDPICGESWSCASMTPSGSQREWIGSSSTNRGIG